MLDQTPTMTPPLPTGVIPTIRRLKAKHRIGLLAGFHVDTDEQGRDTLYNQGAVFMSRKALYKKWPEKFRKADDYEPLSGGELKIAEAGVEIDAKEDDDEYEEVPNPNIRRPSYPLSSSPEDKQREAREGMQGAQNLAQAAKASRQEDDSTLQQMTVNELKAYADDEEIDLKNMTKKEDILRIIRQARGPA